MESCACLKEMVELWLHGIVAYIEGLIFDPKLWYLEKGMHGSSRGKLSLN